MASLTETSIISRKFIRYGIYFLIFLISARFLFNTAKTIWLTIFPPPPAKPTLVFGNLPKLPFPEKVFPKELNINIETAEGTLPTLAAQLPIYQMPTIPQNIKALDEAKDIATKLGFDPNGAPLLSSTPSVYRFPKKGLPSSLRMNIITKIFSIDYDILQNPKVVQGIPADKDQAVGQLISYIRNSGVLRPDIEAGVTTHQFYRVEVDKFIPVSSQSEANLIKINFFRKNFGLDSKVISVTPDYPEANIWFMMGALGTREIVRAEYYYFPIDESKSGTYPLLNSQQALDKLKAGQAYLVSFDSKGKNVTIRKMYLAYYDAGQYQEYYQPVFVFEGDDNFRAYVPAVNDDYYGKGETPTPKS
jgi:hypothetical protein